MLNDFLDLLFPRSCVVCSTILGKGERSICTSCRLELPETSFQLQNDNPVEKLFWGKVEVTHASACYYFEKGNSVQRILHALKYKGKQEVGADLGEMMGLCLYNTPFYRDIDCIIPVPLHPGKLKKRGYNQSDCLSEGMAEVLGKPVFKEVLKRARDNTTQTKKGVYERFQNVDRLFELDQAEKIRGKKVLLVDDVVTTGSTLASCVAALSEEEDVKICAVAAAVPL